MRTVIFLSESLMLYQVFFELLCIQIRHEQMKARKKIVGL